MNFDSLNVNMNNMDEFTFKSTKRVFISANKRVQTAVRKVDGHECNLPTLDSVIVEEINTGLLVHLRRRYIEFVTVDPSNSKSKQLFRSTDEIVQEQRRHIYKHYKIIHPCSKAREYWETFMIPVLFLFLVVVPYFFYNHSRSVLFVIGKLVVDIIGTLDMLLWCFTGYIDVEQQKVVLNSRKIFWKYFKTYFIVDLLSSLPFHFFVVVVLNEQEDYVIIPMFLKLLRLPLFFRYLKAICRTWTIWMYLAKMVKFFINLLILNIWSTLIIARLRFGIENDEFSYALYKLTKVYMRGGQSNPDDKSVVIIIITIMIFALGIIVKDFCLAALMQAYMTYADITQEYEAVSKQIAEYMRFLKLPEALRKKVFEYVRFKIRKCIWHEENILKTVSPILREEMMRHTCQKLIERVDLFEDLPKEVMSHMMKRMRSTVCLPNDVVIQSGSVGSAMFFVVSGMVAVYSQNGKEMCHITDGGHFGEVALIINESRVASVVALHTCELLRLSRKDFQDAIEPFPGVLERIRMAALRKLEMSMSQSRQSSFHSNVDL